MGSPFRFRGSSFRCGLPHSIETKASFLTHTPRSFGMMSPCGSSVVVGSHLITNEGFHWWLGQDPSGLGHPLIASEGLSWCELMAAYCSTLPHWSMLVRMCYI